MTVSQMFTWETGPNLKTGEREIVSIKKQLNYRSTFIFFTLINNSIVLI